MRAGFGAKPAAARGGGRQKREREVEGFAAELPMPARFVRAAARQYGLDTEKLRSLFLVSVAKLWRFVCANSASAARDFPFIRVPVELMNDRPTEVELEVDALAEVPVGVVPAFDEVRVIAHRHAQVERQPQHEQVKDWRAYLTDDDEAVMFCPECAEHEFGASG